MDIEFEKLMTPKKFSIMIEKIAKDSGCNHMDAVIDYCEKNKIEPEQIKPLVTKSLKEKLESKEKIQISEKKKERQTSK